MKVKRYILLNALIIGSFAALGQVKTVWSEGKQVELNPIELDVVFSSTELNFDDRKSERKIDEYYSDRLNHYYVMDKDLSENIGPQAEDAGGIQKISGFTEPNGDTLFPTPFVILKMKDGRNIESVISELTNHEIVDYFSVYGIYVLQVANIKDVFNISNIVFRTGLTDWCRPSFLRKFKRQNTWDNQYYLHNKMRYCGAFDNDIDALEAWEISLGCSNVRVAVIDDGVENHPDLNDRNGASRVLPGYSVPGSSPNGRPDQQSYHGQPCAGIIAASHSQNIRGIAPEISIVPVNIGLSSNTIADEMEIFIALNWAWDRAGGNADVLSNSWGPRKSSNFSNFFITAIQNAQTYGRGGDLQNQTPGLGSIVVFSSGNDGLNEVSEYAKNSIAVGALNRNDQPASNLNISGGSARYTNVGPNQDLMAYGGDTQGPDGDIRTLDRVGSQGINSGNYTNTFSGTSAAAPMVSGGAALILSINPNLSRTEVEDILFSNATDLGSPGKDNTFGYGKLNLRDAWVEAAKTRENFNGFYTGELSTSNLSKDEDDKKRIFLNTPGCGIAATQYITDVWKLEETIPSDEVIPLGGGLNGANPNDGKYSIQTHTNGSSTVVRTFYYFIENSMSGQAINKWVPVNPHLISEYRSYIANPPEHLFLSHTIAANYSSDTSASESINLVPGFEAEKGSIFCTSLTNDLDDLPLSCLSNPSSFGKHENYIKPTSSTFESSQNMEDAMEFIHVYPNPTHANLYVKVGNRGALNRYEITGSDGRILCTGELSGSLTNVKHGLEKGVYFLELYGEQIVRVKKIIVK